MAKSHGFTGDSPSGAPESQEVAQHLLLSLNRSLNIPIDVVLGSAKGVKKFTQDIVADSLPQSTVQEIQELLVRPLKKAGWDERNMIVSPNPRDPDLYDIKIISGSLNALLANGNFSIKLTDPEHDMCTITSKQRSMD